MKCTYEGCLAEGVVQKRAKDGDVFAVLCIDHDAEHEAKLAAWMGGGGIPAMKAFLGFHVRAQGGAKVAARRTAGERNVHGVGTER